MSGIDAMVVRKEKMLEKLGGAIAIVIMLWKTMLG